MAAGIFVSYRRDDTRHAAGRLADELAQAFGADSIFRDIEGIDPGVDFGRALERALEDCVVMLVLIGRQWLDVRNGQGQRRLDDGNDWIRLEIATALARDVRVIPVLVEDAPLPQAHQLPPDLQALVRRQALALSDGRWRGDVQRLVETLAKVPGLEPVRPAPPPPAPPPAPTPAPPPAGRKQLWWGMALGATGVLVLAGLLAEEEGVAPLPPDDRMWPAPSPQPAPAAAPAAMPAPSPAPSPAAALRDISGPWRTTTGESYVLRQDGHQISLTAEAGGEVLGHGSGEFDGQRLRLSLTLRVQGVALGVAQCELQSSPNGQGFAGLCHGPNGPFAAQMFR